MIKTIRIDTCGKQLMRYWKIYLGDVEISQYVNRIGFESGVNEFPYVHVTLVGQLELPSEIKALITVDSVDSYGGIKLHEGE